MTATAISNWRPKPSTWRSNLTPTGKSSPSSPEREKTPPANRRLERKARIRPRDIARMPRRPEDANVLWTSRAELVPGPNNGQTAPRRPRPGRREMERRPARRDPFYFLLGCLPTARIVTALASAPRAYRTPRGSACSRTFRRRTLSLDQTVQKKKFRDRQDIKETSMNTNHCAYESQHEPKNIKVQGLRGRRDVCLHAVEKNGTREYWWVLKRRRRGWRGRLLDDQEGQGRIQVLLRRWMGRRRQRHHTPRRGTRRLKPGRHVRPISGRTPVEENEKQRAGKKKCATTS